MNTGRDLARGADGMVRSGSLRNERQALTRSERIGRYSVVSAMVVARTGPAFFLDILDLAAGCHLPVAAHHTSTVEFVEAQQAYETHESLFMVLER